MKNTGGEMLKEGTDKITWDRMWPTKNEKVKP